MEEIIQEKISADHLLYVSLKYTKTCDVILNLIIRWRKMIDTSIEEILKKAKKKKKISAIPTNPTKKIEVIKNVTLKVFYQGEEININLEKLKLYAEELEKFIDTTKKFLISG